MKKIVFFLLILILFSTTCNDPVFYEVYIQVKIPPPLIEGTPTDLIAIDANLYVASAKTLYCYVNIDSYPSGYWTKLYPNIGHIFYIAKVGASRLCLLSERGLYYIDNPNTSSAYNRLDTSGYSRLYSMYSAYNNSRASSRAYISAMRNDGTHCFLYLDSGALNEITNPLSGKPVIYGAANSGSSDYLAVSDIDGGGGNVGGIYNVSSATFTTGYGTAFTGIAAASSGVIAISRNGGLYNGSGEYLGSGTGTLSSGALFVCDSLTDPGNKLLLAGRQDNLEYNTKTGYTYGYLEIPLTAGGLPIGSFREPGQEIPSTIQTGKGNNERYKTSIGKYPVKYFYQATNGVIFASTELKGVWSLKERDLAGNPYWNTEN